ncbi:TetR/AcrR family transcriptional regulator [Sphingomonas aracearum]|uniref:TetR/AcrR family transcriptional regulator n=2 Tax=Sphingomonas aracearum TaxID=2283317 RepID=A0A369W0C9_9SPHN|nr:TetR/AcrR family transcriptional regulator [Sphingomonas aracearum]
MASDYGAVIMNQKSPSRSTGRPSRDRAVLIDGTIVNATLDAFIEHGIEFSMDGVAQSAGISKQAIYRRWPSKIELLAHAIDAHSDFQRRFLTADLPTDPLEALREFLWRRFDIDESKKNRLNIFLQAAALRNEELRARLIQWRGFSIAMIHERIEQVMLARPTADCDTRALAELISEMLVAASTSRAWLGSGEASRKTTFEQRWKAICTLLQA